MLFRSSCAEGFFAFETLQPMFRANYTSDLVDEDMPGCLPWKCISFTGSLGKEVHHLRRAVMLVGAGGIVQSKL